MIPISETERINAANGGYQIERRHGREEGYTWSPFEIHGSLAEAIQAAAYREIHRLPNDRLSKWYAASGKVIARYEQILARSLESQQDAPNRLGSV